MTEREKQLNDAVYNAALAAQGAPKPEYAGTYEGRLNELFDQISNRDKFSYDVSKDPLYGAYKDEYIQQGKLAMKDTMGQAAALTGGYGNTYGQQVGQQAYDAYLQKLSAAIPELYGMAYKMYQDEGDQLKDLYGMVGAQRDAEYGKYRDDLSDWEYGQNVLRQMEQQEYSRRMDEESIARQLEQQDYERRIYEEEVQRKLEEQAYSRRMQEEAIQRQMEQQEYERQKYDEEVRRKQDQQAWERQQQAYSNLYAIIKASGYSPSDAELQAAGMSREEANALANEFDRQLALEELAREAAAYSSSGRSSGGSSGSSGRYSGTSPSYSYDYDYDYAPSYAQEETYYPGEYERYLRNSIAADTGRSVNQVTAGEVGWNDTAKMLNTLGIAASNNASKSTTTAPKSNTVVNKTTGNSTAAQMAYEAAKRAEEQKKKKGNGGR